MQDKANGWRWGLITLSLGFSCGIMGHYLPGEIAFFTVLGLSGMFALFGGLVINNEM